MGAFVDEYDDLDADSLKLFLEFCGFNYQNHPEVLEQDILEMVVDKYSNPGTHHFTYLEQMRLIEDWFTGELQFTELAYQKNALQNLKEISKTLAEEIEILEETFTFLN